VRDEKMTLILTIGTECYSDYIAVSDADKWIMDYRVFVDRRAYPIMSLSPMLNCTAPR